MLTVFRRAGLAAHLYQGETPHFVLEVIMVRKFWIMALGVTLAGSILVTAAGPRRVQITGAITAIDAATETDPAQITVQTTDEEVTVETVVQVTPATVLTMKGEPITFSVLDVGMTVKVCAKLVGDVLVAEKINVMYLGK